MAHFLSLEAYYLEQESGWKYEGWNEAGAMQIWKSQKQVISGNKAGDWDATGRHQDFERSQHFAEISSVNKFLFLDQD